MFGVPSTTALGSRSFESFKRFVKTVTSSYPLSGQDTNVGIIKYGSRPEVVLRLSQGTSTQAVNRGLDRMTYSSGVQNVPEALKFAGSDMFTSARPGSSRYFVFGAGSESNTEEALKSAAKQLRYQGVSIMPVPIGVARPERSPLKSVASIPQNDFYRPAADTSSLENDLPAQAVSSIVPGEN